MSRCTISYRIPRELRDRIEAAAVTQELNLTQMITLLVERGLANEDLRQVVREEFARERSNCK